MLHCYQLILSFWSLSARPGCHLSLVHNKLLDPLDVRVVADPDVLTAASRTTQLFTLSSGLKVEWCWWNANLHQDLDWKDHYSLKIEPSDSIKNVKGKIQDRTRRALQLTSRDLFIFVGKQLKDGRTLSHPEGVNPLPISGATWWQDLHSRGRTLRLHWERQGHDPDHYHYFGWLYCGWVDDLAHTMFNILGFPMSC